MSEIVKEASSVGDALDSITALVEEKKARGFADYDFYFRGENRNFFTNDGEIPSASVPTTLYRDEGLVANEHIIFNEILRTYPEIFSEDKTTFEMLARMQHYYFPTRLMDVTTNIMVALGFAIAKGVNATDDYMGVPGFVHVYAAKRDKIKYSTGDTVSGICAMVKVPADRIVGKKLECVAYEAQKERPGFDRYHDFGDTTERFDRDRRKVWCVKSVLNNKRIKAQSGDFFLFGCEDRKKALKTTFLEDDLGNPMSATENIARIGVLRVTPACKERLRDALPYLGIGIERLYPEFSKFNEYIYKQYKRK